MLKFSLDTRQLSKDNPSQNLSQFQVCSYASLESPSPFCLAIIITPFHHHLGISSALLLLLVDAARNLPWLVIKTLFFCFRLSLLAVIWGSRLWVLTLGKTVSKGLGILSILKSHLYSAPFCSTAKQLQYFTPPSFMALARLACWLQVLEDNSLYE